MANQKKTGFLNRLFGESDKQSGRDTVLAQASKEQSDGVWSLSQIEAIGDVDPVAEADVYLAYGRDRNAEEILIEALLKDPKRLAIHLKLAEVLVKRRDIKGLERRLVELHALTDESSEAWQRAMGFWIQAGGSAAKSWPRNRSPSFQATEPGHDTSQSEAGILADQGPTKVENIAQADALSRTRITTALSTLLTQRSSTHPMAIGLFGHWGAGKSSQVEFLRRSLMVDSAPAVRVVVFNAWQHEHSDNVGAALAQTIVEFFVSELGFFSQLNLAVRVAAEQNKRLRKSISRDADRFRVALVHWAAVIPSLLVPSIAVALLSFFAMEWLMSSNSTQTALSIFGAIGTAWVATQRFIADKLLRLFTSGGGHTSVRRRMGLPDFREKMGVFHEIHRSLETLCELCIARGNDPKEGEYLLLVVDDLDRCEPATVKNVLDAVRLVADVHRVVTLVAIDERIAFAAVTKHFEKFGFPGRDPGLVARDYLAKVFQVAITLPEVPPSVAGEFIQNELFRDDVAPNYSGMPPAADSLPSNFASIGDEPLGITRSSSAPQKIALLRTLPEEVTAFREMAAACHFKNPRQLWRLKQAWQLLKGISLQEGSGMRVLKQWMRMLFLREYLLQIPPTERASIEQWLMVKGSGTEAPPVLSRLADGSIESSFAGYEAMSATVSMVLLPASAA